jgi:hypothetical protein
MTRTAVSRPLFAPNSYLEPEAQRPTSATPANMSDGAAALHGLFRLLSPLALKTAIVSLFANRVRSLPPSTNQVGRD